MKALSRVLVRGALDFITSNLFLVDRRGLLLQAFNSVSFKLSVDGETLSPKRFTSRILVP